MMWQLPQTPDVIIALGTLLAGSAAIWGAFSAHRGLESWTKQSLWQDERKLAKDLLVVLQERKDAVDQIRSPFGSFSKAALADQSLRWEETKADYSNRAKALSAAQKKFYSLQIEGEIFWGAEFSSHTRRIASLEAELWMAIEDYLESKRPDSDAVRAFKEEHPANLRVVFGHRGASDEFNSKYSSAVDKIRLFLLPKLGL